MPTPTAPRSTLVTAVGWVFLVIGAFFMVNGVLASFALGHINELHAVIQDMRADSTVPPAIVFVAEHLQFLVLGVPAVAAATTVSAIGVIRRQNWARLIFICVLALGALWTVGVVILQQVMMASGPPPEHARLAVVATLVRTVTAIVGLGVAALLCWLIRRFTSPDIRAEFASANNVRV